MQTDEVKISHSLQGTWIHGAQRRRLVIMCHGYKSSSKNSTLVYIASAINALGYDTFAFSFSENRGGFDIEHQVGDIAQITAHFAEYQQIVLIGASFAGLTTAIATIELPAISALITLNGFFGRGELGPDHRRTYRKFRLAAIIVPAYRRIYHYYSRKLQPERITVPTLVIHAVQDQVVFISQSKWFYGRLTGSKTFVKLETANHGVVDDADRDAVVTAVDRWLKLINNTRQV